MVAQPFSKGEPVRSTKVVCRLPRPHSRRSCRDRRLANRGARHVRRTVILRTSPVHLDRIGCRRRERPVAVGVIGMQTDVSRDCSTCGARSSVRWGTCEACWIVVDEDAPLFGELDLLDG